MTTIRRATCDDTAVIADLLGQLGYPAAPADVARRLDALNGHDNAMFVAVNAGGRVAAFASTHLIPTVHLDAPVGYITAFSVDVSTRGQGVGRSLLAALEQWAREQGCAKLTVTSAEQRADAHAFYPACGLAYTGRRFAKALT